MMLVLVLFQLPAVGSSMVRMLSIPNSKSAKVPLVGTSPSFKLMSDMSLTARVFLSVSWYSNERAGCSKVMASRSSLFVDGN